MNGRNYSGVLGIFSHLDSTLAARARLDAAGWRELHVLSPVPRHEILDAIYPTPSPVRVYSLLGGITGTAAGFLLAWWTGREMHRMAYLVSGKPTDAWQVYVVIGFELTVLIGTLATMAGFLLHSGLPNWRWRAPYDARFSDDRFGLFVVCDESSWEEVMRLLRGAGAEEVRGEKG
jgi:hypothetical protein